MNTYNHIHHRHELQIHSLISKWSSTKFLIMKFSFWFLYQYSMKLKCWQQRFLALCYIKIYLIVKIFVSELFHHRYILLAMLKIKLSLNSNEWDFPFYHSNQIIFLAAYQNCNSFHLKSFNSLLSWIFIL